MFKIEEYKRGYYTVWEEKEYHTLKFNDDHFVLFSYDERDIQKGFIKDDGRYSFPLHPVFIKIVHKNEIGELLHFLPYAKYCGYEFLISASQRKKEDQVVIVTDDKYLANQFDFSFNDFGYAEKVVEKNEIQFAYERLIMNK